MQTVEVAREPRFGFGRNWRQYIGLVDEQRIDAAVDSLRTMLGVDTLGGRSFLDVGCGSGLFSLAARRLGARVHSFDYDADSVAAARELQQRFQGADADWTIEQGSILDEAYVAALGTWDIVYSWGVLHHTGDMWRAIDMACSLVAPHGSLFIAIYNDQGEASRRWLSVKRTYNESGAPTRAGLLAVSGAYLLARGVISRVARKERRAATLASPRGMSRWYDLVDWVGGYPFEVARPEQIVDGVAPHGFQLQRVVTCGTNLGCNEFVFRKP